MKNQISQLVFPLVLTIFPCANAPAATPATPTVDHVVITYRDITGIGVNNTSDHGDGVVRRDPSDVVKIGKLYYVFYAHAFHRDYKKYGGGGIRLKSGYYGTVWYATSPDGYHWTERGQAVGRGKLGKLDSNGVFSPNIVKAPDGKYYVFYVGVPFGSKNNSAKDHKYIFAAKLVFNDKGLITAAERINHGDPVLKPTVGQKHDGQPLFDSYLLDDPSLLVRDYDHDGDLDIGLYYKGRAQGRSPSQTKMGLAIADDINKPFIRDPHSADGNVAQNCGHEVMVFAYGKGVMSLVTHVGHGLFYAPQGKHFTKIADFKGPAFSPGAYRPELSDPAYNAGVQWGIDMRTRDDTPYLVHWSATGLHQSK